MKLTREICSRARLSRDPRFDGKFYIAVRRSGVYCRPICPTPTAKESNVRYYPTAAAAAEAGFRPCLRCRPECSPGTPGWIGTPITVSRALRLISDGGLENGGVEALSGRLGVGSRHLRRLFLQHLGATPRAIAQTRRLHFAKKLIDETRLPMSQLAMASGFGCVRRFNAAMRETYQRTPTEIRRLARQKVIEPEGEYVFHVRFRQPFHWDGLLQFFGKRAVPGVEVVDHNSYRRSISMHGHDGGLEVSRSGPETLRVRIQFPDPRSLFAITERIRAMFDLGADWTDIAQTLRTDSALAHRVKIAPGLRVPGCWNGFELATRAILGQQVSVAAATRLAGRIVELFGRASSLDQGIAYHFPRPETLAEADATRAGVTKARASAIRALACAVCEGKIDLESCVDSEGLIRRLGQVPGIGTWTTQYIAMRALREPDAFPSGDIALLRALGLDSRRALEQRSEAWRPWRAYAAMYLWTV